MNISSVLTQSAKMLGDKIAIIDSSKKALTFSQLEDLSNSFANGLKKLGVEKGDKVLVFLKPSLEFPAMAFALYKLQAIPIFIDPGMGKQNLLNSIKSIRPKVLIAIPKVFLAKFIYPDYFASIKIQVKTGSTWQKITGLIDLEKFPKDFTVEETPSDDTAAILFTSGGTGTPKGVVYTHKIFKTQMDLLGKMYQLSPADIDLSGFPLFSLFTVGLGMTTIIPRLDVSKPSSCDPAKIVSDIQTYKVTYCSGSPAIWTRVADYCIQKGITLPSLKSLVMFGAPIPLSLHQKFKKILTHGDTYTPYGATESLPVSSISGSEILEKFSEKMKHGFGTCVGKPIIEVKIIPITDNRLTQITPLKPNEVGEIVVSGESVTASYFERDLDTKNAKIIDGGILYHRMGDLGYLDDKGYLWFCGRKAHRVLDLYSIPCEAIFNNHPEVARSALIEYFDKPALVIERLDQKIPKGLKRKNFEEELKNLGKNYSHTKEITTFFYKKTFPVDVRHNIKIDRLLLADEARKGVL